MEKIQRNWGHFVVLYERADKKFKVKQLTIEPGQCTSLQQHRFRSEFFFVEKGSVVVEVDGATFLAHENETFKIEKNDKHRLRNHTTDLVVLIEIQTGSLVAEDDIIRYDVTCSVDQLKD